MSSFIGERLIQRQFLALSFFLRSSQFYFDIPLYTGPIIFNEMHYFSLEKNN